MQKKALLERIKKLARPIYPTSFEHDTKLKKLSGIKCVAFDFYGTMFISGVGDIGVDEEQKSAHKRYFEEALKDAGFSIESSSIGETGLNQFQKAIEKDITKKKETGIDYPEPDIIAVWITTLNKLLVDGHITGSSISKSKAIQFAVEFEFRANTIWPVPNLDNILHELLKKDLKLGIISNSQFYTPLAFEALIGQSPNDYGFDPALLKWSFDNGIKKPSVDFYRQFTKELPAQNLSPKEVLYVGNDLFKDIIPAKKLNMKTALYVGDERSKRHEIEDLTPPEHQPDIIIDNLHQIKNCLA